jgi:hypothetical protein
MDVEHDKSALSEGVGDNSARQEQQIAIIKFYHIERISVAVSLKCRSIEYLLVF